MNRIKSEKVAKNNDKILSAKNTLSKNDIGGQYKNYNEIKKLFQKTYKKLVVVQTN